MSIITKEKTIKVDIDYKRIFEEMNDESFRFCVKHLYPVLNYHVLREDDVRKVDLFEKMYEPLGLYEYDNKYLGTMNRFIDVFRAYLTNTVLCDEKSRAYEYKSSVKFKLGKKLDTLTLQDIDDAFMIFICLVRPFYKDDKQLKNVRKEKLSNIDLYVEENDAEVLKALFGKDELLPDSIKKNKSISKTKIYKLMYINCILFLSRALQNCGGYDLEKN